MEDHLHIEQGPEAKTESQKIADELRSVGEELGFDPETCDEIARMPFDDAFETAFSYLTQAGLDPEEVLSNFLNPNRT